MSCSIGSLAGQPPEVDGWVSRRSSFSSHTPRSVAFHPHTRPKHFTCPFPCIWHIWRLIPSFSFRLQSRVSTGDSTVSGHKPLDACMSHGTTGNFLPGITSNRMMDQRVMPSRVLICTEYPIGSYDHFFWQISFEFCTSLFHINCNMLNPHLYLWVLEALEFLARAQGLWLCNRIEPSNQSNWDSGVFHGCIGWEVTNSPIHSVRALNPTPTFYRLGENLLFIINWQWGFTSETVGPSHGGDRPCGPHLTRIGSNGPRPTHTRN